MQRKFIKNLALLIFLNLLVKPFWILGVDRKVYNLVGTEDYGFYFTILNFSFLFYIFLDLGITNFNNRNIAQNHQLLNKHLAGIGVLKIALGLFYGILIFIIGIMIGYNADQLQLLAWVGFNQFLLSLILYLRSNISGLLLFKTESFLSVLDRSLMIIICGLFLWTNISGGHFTIKWFVYSQTVAYSLTALIALGIVLKKSGKIRFNWNWPFIVLILKKSYPFAMLALLMSFYNRIDPVLIERLLPENIGNYQSGIYSASFRLLDAGQNFALLFALLLLPIFSKMIKDKHAIEGLVKMSFILIFCGTLIIAVTSFFYSEQLMHLMYPIHSGESDQMYEIRIVDSAQIFVLLMFSLVAISTTYIFGTLLTANNNLNQLNVVALIGLAINLLLNFILIPEMYALGSAYASLVSQAVTALIQVFLAFRIFSFKIRFPLVFKVLLFLVMLIIVGFLFQEYELLEWKVSALLMAGTGLFLIFFLRLLKLSELVSYFKSEIK